MPERFFFEILESIALPRGIHHFDEAADRLATDFASDRNLAGRGLHRGGNLQNGAVYHDAPALPKSV
jgi:hypothetical protein